MEYDNDRLRRRTSRLEIMCWILLGMIQPVTTALTLFNNDWIAWTVFVPVICALVFLLYLLYVLLLRTVLIERNKKWQAAGITLLIFLAISGARLWLYSLVPGIDHRLKHPAFFTFDSLTALRESWWTALNMSLCIAILFIGHYFDEKSLLQDAKKESSFFQLRYLRAQLNPHFLFNTLNSIYSLSLQKSDRAPEVVVRLADIMRYLIYECDEETIPLDKEIEFIRNYIEIEKIRHTADIRLTVEGNTSGVRIEPFLFISFIENGFKHAMDHSFGEPFIYITVKISNGQLTLNVINSMEADLGTQAKRINGKGIAHSRSLLELLYPAAYDLDIIQTQKDESRTSKLRLRHARERLENLYPDSHTLDVILNKSSFTVSLILKNLNAC